MIENIKSRHERCLKEWNNLLDTNKLPIAAHSVVSKLVRDAQKSQRIGDWDLAVTFSQYANDIAKIYGYSGWYDYFVEVRRARDEIEVMVRSLKEQRERKQRNSQ